MKLEQKITTTDTPGQAKLKVAAYFAKLGYQPVPSDTGSAFRRGSRIGSMFSSDPHKWLTLATAQYRQYLSQDSEVIIQIDARPFDQLAAQSEKKVLERELEGFIKILNPAEYEKQLPTIKQNYIQDRSKAENQLKSGANSFFFIAGFSLINTLLFFLGGNVNFLIGLGITQLIDGIASAIATDFGSDVGLIAQLFALLIDIVIAGIFVLFGIFSRKQAKWSFFVGTTLYALDILIFLLVKDFWSIGFHILMLFWLFSGMMAIERLNQLAKGRAQL